MKNYSEDRRIIKQAIEENRLVVFVGAGVSVNSGVPLWKDAIEKINMKLDLQLSVENDTLKIPQIYFNERGKKEYHDLIKEIFKYEDKEANERHDLIVKLRPNCIITTNYDDFIEKAFIKNGEFLDVIKKDSDIAYSRNNRMIIKMHGSFTHENTVLKEDDYLNYSTNFPLIETFVKALVAKNIVLFIGYSYNDSDTRQIFGWVKNILGNNFQRSYFLDADKCFNLELYNYYKNLGINTLYACECDAIITEKNKIFSNTKEFLNYLIKDEEETDIENIIYNQAKYFEDLNYILSRYMPIVFEGTKVHISERIIYADDSMSEELFLKLAEERNDGSSEKLSLIRYALRKTNLIKSCKRDEKSHKSRDLCIFENVQNDQVYFDIDKQNFTNLQNHVKKLQTIKNDNDKMKLCYCLFHLKEYQSCYELLEEISSSYKQKQKYVHYFLSEFNRFHVADIWNFQEYFNTNERSKQNIEEIDLSDIIYSNYLRRKNENKYLSDLENFSLMYKMLTQVKKISDGVEKDTESNFIGGCLYGKIDLMEDVVKDFYDYLKFNHLMIDDYTEVRDVFKQYVDACLYSHSKEEKESEDEMLKGRNKVLKEISPFFIMIVCKFIDNKTLTSLLKKNNTKKIVLAVEAIEVLFEIFNNYQEAIQNKIRLQNSNDKIFVILEIIGLANINKEKCNLTFNILKDLITRNIFKFTDFREINKFVVSLYKTNEVMFTVESIIETLEVICKGFEKNQWDDVELGDVKRLFKNLCNILKNLFPDAMIDDYYSDIVLKKNYVDILPNIFIIVSENTKNVIKNQIEEELKDTVLKSDLYCNAVNAEIILKSIDYENRLFGAVKKIYEDKSPVKVFPDPLEHILVNCINLYLSNNLLLFEKLELYLKEYPNLEFIYDMDHFNYANFKISWFEKENEGLKERIVENKLARENIRKIYQEAIKANDYDESMIENYFEYLVEEKDVQG